MTTTIWNESTREELGAALPGSVVVLPTAATEQHGPHLATGHDAFTVDEIAHRAAERAGETATVIVAPRSSCLGGGAFLPGAGWRASKPLTARLPAERWSARTAASAGIGSGSRGAAAVSRDRRSRS